MERKEEKQIKRINSPKDLEGLSKDDFVEVEIKGIKGMRGYVRKPLITRGIFLDRTDEGFNLVKDSLGKGSISFDVVRYRFSGDSNPVIISEGSVRDIEKGSEDYNRYRFLLSELYGSK